jgi:Protein of unknown function (DUF3833)
MKKAIKLLVIIATFGLITSCGSYNTKDFANNKPKLDIREYLNGDVVAHGMIFDWSGKPTRHFTATIKGEWNGNSGTLTEHFTFSDGEKQERIWQIKFSDEHNFTATAGDVIGDGIGTQHGNAVNMAYMLRHKDTDGSEIDLKVDDWLFLTNDNVLLNRSKLYKFGIQVGEVFIAFTKKQ